MDGPCSNDNPDYDTGTQPCPGSTTSWGGTFDGAIDIDPPDVVADAVEDFYYPSFYSCVATTEGELVVDDDDAAAESSTFRFGYEVYYTSPLPSPDNDEYDDDGAASSAAGDRLRAVLDDFELRLARGVASRLGLVDGEDGGCIDVDDAEPEFEVFADVARTNDEGGRRRRGMMMMRRRRRRMDSLGGRLRRRTIATRAVVAADGPSVAGVSSLPEDVADGESRESVIVAETAKTMLRNHPPS